MDKIPNKRYNKSHKGVVYMSPTATKLSVPKEKLEKVSKESFSVEDLMELNESTDLAGKTFQELYKEGK